MPQFYMQPQDKPRNVARRALYSAVALAAALVLLIVAAGIVNAPRIETEHALYNVQTPTTRITPLDRREAMARIERQSAAANPFHAQGGAR